jgi:diguanylate cyclase (GGDEF)-like protein/PAS domain S-box-containing protein
MNVVRATIPTGCSERDHRDISGSADPPAAGGSVTMLDKTRTNPNKTRAELAAENESLLARLTELERIAAGRVQKTNARERSKDSLQASEIRYRRLFETAKDGILILDADSGKITDANPFLEVLLGYSHDELVGRALWEIGPFRDVAASRNAFRELQRNEYIRYEDLPLETKDHERRNVEFVSNVYLADGARVIQCNIRDITSRRQAEEITRHDNEELAGRVRELRLRDSNMQVLNRMTDLLQTCSTQEEVFKVVALMADELFPAMNGFLAILSAGERLETVARWGTEPPQQAVFALDDCWAMRRGQPHEVLDPQGSLLCRHFVLRPDTGYLCVPLTVQGETLGVLCLIGLSTGKGESPSSQTSLAVTVGEDIKLSLFNLRLREKLREQATRDSLTGLYNRRYLEESLERELYRTNREGTPLCVAMLDLDYLKKFNDTFGHEAGDRVLRELGRVLREKLRKSDISCRFGGEEFVLVLPGSTLSDAQQRVEQIRLLVKGLQIRHDDQILGRLTVSGGVAASPEHGSTAAELIRAADDALYAAKQAGRDRVVAYEGKDPAE